MSNLKKICSFNKFNILFANVKYKLQIIFYTYQNHFSLYLHNDTKICLRLNQNAQR